MAMSLYAALLGFHYLKTFLQSSGRYWALSDLSCATRQGEDGSYMAPISLKGSVQFSTSAFPPEMFVKLTSGELKMYNDYWEAIETKYEGLLDRAVIHPRLDINTGDVYVLRCYFAGADTDLPPLPYKLLPTQEAADIWSFGRFLFILCSSGHPLFPANLRTDQLLDYDQVASWDREKRERIIYEYVENPLAQDLLLHLLSSHEERASLRMETILKHPFFTNTVENVQLSDKMLRRIVDQRVSDGAACKRSYERSVLMRSDDEWLKSRSKTVSFWDLGFQMRMHLAPSGFVQREFSAGHRVGIIPYSIIVLPYKLVRNKAGKLTPSTKRDVELAEQMGARLINLSKACHFALQMEHVIQREEDSSHRWSSSEIIESMDLSSGDFKLFESKLVALASEKVEVFRDSPLLIARIIVQEHISELQALFNDSSKAFLYLVDEYDGVPVVGTTAGMTYPIEVTKKITEVVGRGLPFMQLCMLYAKGVAGDVSGLVKLIFEAAYPHIPPSWGDAAQGLSHNLDEGTIKDELRILREAAVETQSGSVARGIDDMRYFQDMFERVDVKRSFADLKRVTNGEDSLWTSNDGVEKIKQLASAHSLAEAYKVQKKTEQKLLEQQRKIVELEEAMEQLEFRRKHNLQEPFAS